MNLPDDPLAFLQPDETAKQFLARTWVDPIPSGVDLIDKFVRMKPGSVLEISGQSSTRKTMILCHLIATTILPKEIQFGQESVVIFIDVQMKFDILLLQYVLKWRIAQQQLNQQVQDQILKSSLQRLLLLRCNSTLQFLVAVNQLPKLMEKVQNENQRVLMLMIDGIDAYSIIDRQSVISADCGRDPINVQSVNRCTIRILTKLIKEFKPIVVVTKTVKILIKEDGRLNVRDPLLPEWQKIVQQQLVLAQGDLGMVCQAEWVLPRYAGRLYYIAKVNGIQLVQEPIQDVRNVVQQ